jgi:hypothetical protein
MPLMIHDAIGLVVIVLAAAAILTLYGNAYARIRRTDMSDMAKAIWTVVLLIPTLGVVLVFLCVPRSKDPMHLWR